MASVQAEISDLCADLQENGWRIIHRQGHRLAYPPDASKTPVTLHSTPRGGRWRLNLRGHLAQRGYVWTPANGVRKGKKTKASRLEVTSVHATQEALPAVHIESEDASMAQPATTPTPAEVFPGGTPTLAAVPDVVGAPPKSKRETAIEQVYEDLRVRITSGDLAPGMRVPTELTLAAQYGMGNNRDPVRQALRRLDAEGLTRVKSRSGGRLVLGVPAEETAAAVAAIGEAKAQVATVQAEYEAAAQVVDAQPEPKPERPSTSRIIAQARQAFDALTALMGGLIEAAERAEADVAEALTMAQSAEARAAKAEGRAAEYEQEVIDARRKVRDAECRLQTAFKVLKGEDSSQAA